MQEKYGVDKDALLQNLQNEEAQLMQQIQRFLSDPEKTASDRQVVEDRLYQVRNKIAEIIQ